MSELRTRPPAGDWREDARAVALLTFDFDAESPILAEGSRYAEDLSTMSHQAYGPKVGVPRILDLLANHEVEATFFVPGVTAEQDFVSFVRECGDVRFSRADRLADAVLQDTEEGE